MKNKALHFFLFISFYLLMSFRSEAQIKNEIIGNWNFECPRAPAIFDSGVIYIHNDSVFTSFASITYKFPSVWVKVKADSLFYDININGDDQLYVVKIENKDSLNGVAVTSYGASPLILTKKIASSYNPSKHNCSFY
jgi:hypothetical protein